jgi:hypothetical protein
MQQSEQGNCRGVSKGAEVLVKENELFIDPEV